MFDTNIHFIGKVLNFFDELPSTNLYAMELLAKSRPTEGTVISTYNQTAGRGQIGRSWESTPGKNLTFSIILYPDFLPAIDQFLLNKAFALGVRSYVAACIPQATVSVKWPNDIYVGQRKIAGILIQNVLQGKHIQSTVLGVGLNVNQASFQEAPNATSLLLETGKSFSLEEALLTLCVHIETWYLLLRDGRTNELDRSYLQHLFLFEKTTWFQRGDNTVFQGKITGVAADGRLLIASGEQTAAFDIKQVQWVQPPSS